MQKNKARSDGRLQAQVYIGVVDGKRKYKYVYADTQRALDKKVQELKIKLGKGIDLTADRDTFGYWGEKWLKVKESEVSYSWHKVLKINYDKLADISGVRINQLRPFDLQEILIDLAAEQYSKRVIKAVRDIANGIMQLAADNRAVEYNVFVSVTLPKAKAPEQRRALTETEQRWIADTPHRAQTAAMIMMYAGLRRGELIALTWEDIDLSQGIISVSKSVEMIDGSPVIKGGGKTECAARRIYMPNPLIEYLKKVPCSRFSPVCSTVRGKLITDSAWRRLWESYLICLDYKYGNREKRLEVLKKAQGESKTAKDMRLTLGIPYFTAHWLRHTFITNMYLAGIDVLTAKDQAGHSDIKTTLEIYTHLDKEYKKKDMQKLNQYYDACHMPVS